VKVLHAPSEIAGQTSILARALRDLGVEAWSLATNPTFAQHSVDEMRPFDTRGALPRYAGYAGLLAKHLFRWDVFHFHFGRTLIPPHNFDLPLYHALGKTVVFHYHGCDVRNRAHMLATHAHATCTECAPTFCIPARQKRILRAAERAADAEIVSTPDLLESATRAAHVHVAVWLPDYVPTPFRETPKLVLHAPTNRGIKGTPYIEKAFERLRPKFPQVEFRVVEKLDWPALRTAMAECDVFVDQLQMGWYGMVSAEAMACGKPSMAYIRPDFERRLKDGPIVRTSIETLAADLEALLTDAPRRRDLGERSRAYVEREHDAHVVAARLIDIYRAAGAR
jgi:glycosyltransferase involved in cell wall biosynthesis